MNALGDIWGGLVGIGPKSYMCGYCGDKTGVKEGYKTKSGQGNIYICGGCNRPTYFELSSNQTPAPILGNEVENLPEEIKSMYVEARNCTRSRSYTACVLTCRKLLMHIAVQKGASEGIHFIEYVEFLSENHFIPPGGKEWVDHIRKKGNEANHEIVLMTNEDASQLLSFVEMLLRFIYEFPAKILPSENE